MAFAHAHAVVPRPFTLALERSGNAPPYQTLLPARSREWVERLGTRLVRDLVYLPLTGCVIVSGFRAALDLNTYPLNNLIRPRCTERTKPGRGKAVLIMHNYWPFRLFSCHISRAQSFQQNRHITFHALV